MVTPLSILPAVPPVVMIEGVVAYFGSYGLGLPWIWTEICLWEKKLPLTKSFSGNATSPMIVG